MSPEFRSRRPFRKPGKKTQFALAIILLLIAAAFVAFWVAVRLHQPSAPAEETGADSTEGSGVQADPAWEPAYLLVLLSDEDTLRSVLLRSDPLRPVLQAAPLPAAVQRDETIRLDTLYRKEGAASVTAAVAAALDIPLTHYIAMRSDEVESWLNYLENGLTLVLPEAVRSEMLQLEAGERNLTATQVTHLLHYTDWSDAAYAETVAADALTAMLNQYFRNGRHLQGDFSALSNLCTTDLRISDFTADADRLAYLMAQNQGALCRTVLPQWKQGAHGAVPEAATYAQAIAP